MKLASKKAIEARKEAAKYNMQYWKREQERLSMHLELLYLNDDYISKFGYNDAYDCSERIGYCMLQVHKYEAMVDIEDPSTALAERLGIELA